MVAFLPIRFEQAEESCSELVDDAVEEVDDELDAKDVMAGVSFKWILSSFLVAAGGKYILGSSFPTTLIGGEKVISPVVSNLALMTAIHGFAKRIRSFNFDWYQVAVITRKIVVNTRLLYI